MKKIISILCGIALLISMASPAYAAAKDTKAPVITKTNPSDKSIDVMRESEVVLRFSENIKKSKTFDTISITSVLGKSITYTYEIKDNLLVITPKSDLTYNTDYTVNIPAGAVKDSAGNNLKKAYTFNFITEEDPKAKQVEEVEGITYRIGLQATLQGEFTPALQSYLVQYLEMFGIKAKITEVTKVK